MRIDEIMKSYVPGGPSVRQIRVLLLSLSPSVSLPSPPLVPPARSRTLNLQVMALTPGLSADTSGNTRREGEGEEKGDGETAGADGRVQQ